MPTHPEQQTSTVGHESPGALPMGPSDSGATLPPLDVGGLLKAARPRALEGRPVPGERVRGGVILSSLLAAAAQRGAVRETDACASTEAVGLDEVEELFTAFEHHAALAQLALENLQLKLASIRSDAVRKQVDDDGPEYMPENVIRFSARQRQTFDGSRHTRGAPSTGS